MARSVTFNGITRFKPGGITKINAEALNQVLLSENSIVALVGEAEGGEPGSSAGITTLFDPSRATALYRSGPLADAIRLAFQSSADTDVPGGASRVLVYKTNSSTQATVTLPSAEAALRVGTLSAPGAATSGGVNTLIDTTDPAGFADSEPIGMWIILNPFTSAVEARQVTAYNSGTSEYTVDMGWDGGAPTTDPYLVLEDVMYVGGRIDNSTGGTTIEVKGLATIAADVYAGRWMHIQRTAETAFLRQIVSHDDETFGSVNFIVTPSLPSDFVASEGAWVEVLGDMVDLSSRDYGSHTNGLSVDTDTSGLATVASVAFEGTEEVSPAVGGPVYMKLLYRGGAEFRANDKVAAAPAPTATEFTLQTAGLTLSAHVGTQVLVNGEYTTITANDADTLTVSPALSAAPAENDAVSIRTVTAGTMEVSGAAGAATSLASTMTGVTGDNLAVTFATGQTLRQLVDGINANPNYLATIPNGINPDTTLVADFDFGPGTETSVLNSAELTTAGLKQDDSALVSYFNDFSELVTATRSSSGAYDGSGAPGPTSDFVSMTGGTRGTSSNTSFQAGMDKLLLVRANSVVPLIDQDLTNEGFGSTATVASVAAQLADHVSQARGASNSERGGFFGFQGNKTAVIAQANAVNDFDVAMTAQNPTVLNATGSLQEFGPRMMAVMAASMRSGVTEVAEPLTHKFLRVSGLTQDSSWDPADTTDANEMIINGVLYAESIDGKGTRWVRDLTTHIKDDNLAFSEGSVRDAVRFVAFGLRELLVDRFTGKKAAPATVASIKDTASTFLELTRTDNIIVDSTDPATGSTIRAYHNLKVTTSGDTATINVGVFPVPGINFQLNEIFLQLPTQAA